MCYLGCLLSGASQITFDRYYGPEFTSRFIRKWLKDIGVETLFIEPASPWENGYNESFNGALRDEVLEREVFYTLKEAEVLIERWRIEYNTIRPHSSLGYRSPAPETTKEKGQDNLKSVS